MSSQSEQFVPRDVWNREYASIKAIPSSTREEPAKALVLFADLMSLANGARVLDAGSGNGRNAIFLAGRGCDVTAVDFSGEALNETRRRARSAGLESKINILEAFIGDSLPVATGSIDVAIDCYTFCHFLDESAGRRFWEDITRVTRPNGQIFSIVFSPEDEYYAQFIPNAQFKRIVTDPSNGVSKRLYTEREIKRYFSRTYRYRFFAKFEFRDVVHGKEYQRTVLISVLQTPGLG
jgi:SAM-dependent methyltransferase